MRRILLSSALLALVSAAGRSQPQLAEWRVAAAPLLVLEDNGTPATEFHRISRAWRLPNGNVVVANGATAEMRVFDSRGSLVETYGRTGKGPGEFERISVVEVAGDTAIIYDITARRVTTVHFGAKARTLATITMMAEGVKFGFDVTGRLSDGRWTATAGIGIPGGWDAPRGVTRVKGNVGFVARDGAGTVDWIAEVPGMASISYMPGTDKSKWATGFAPFAPSFFSRVSGGALWFGESASDSLVRVDASGARRRIVLPIAATPLTPQIIASTSEPELAALRRRGASTDYTVFKYSAENLPAKLPYYSALLDGVDGELWVQEYTTVPGTAARYVVINPQGRPIGRVTMPAGFRVTHAGRDFVVGTTRDADELEGVRVFRLERR